MTGGAAGASVVLPRFGVIDDARHRQRRRHARVPWALAALGAMTFWAFGPGQHGFRTLLSAAGFRSAGAVGDPVTLRYAGAATSVRIVAARYGVDPANLGSSSAAVNVAPSDGRSSGVSDGAVLSISMRMDRASGVWTSRIPLPAGVYEYRFLVNCTDQVLANPLLNQCGEFTALHELRIPA